MNIARILWRYFSIKLVVAVFVAIIIYALYWPLFIHAMCGFQVLVLSIPWTVIPGVTPFLIVWFDHLKRKKGSDLDGVSYMLILLNFIILYGGMDVWNLNLHCFAGCVRVC